jgi:hypothetical protein
MTKGAEIVIFGPVKHETDELGQHDEHMPQFTVKEVSQSEIGSLLKPDMRNGVRVPCALFNETIGYQDVHTVSC